MTISPPSVIAESGLSDARDSAEMLGMMMELTGSELDYARPRAVEFNSGLTGTRVHFTTGSGRNLTNGVVLAVEMGDGAADGLAMVLMLSSDYQSIEIEQSVAPMVETFRFIEADEAGGSSGGVKGILGIGGSPSPSDDEIVLSLDLTGDVESQSEVVIEALQDIDLIGTTGELLHSEEVLTTALTGELAVFNETRTREYSDFVIAALISYRPASDFGLCGFLSHMQGNPGSQDAAPLVYVGANEAYRLTVLQSGDVEEEFEIYESDEEYDFYSPHHLIMVVRDGQLTVFIDGVSELRDVELLYLPDAGERVSAGAALDNSCVMTDYWVYGVE